MTASFDIDSQCRDSCSVEFLGVLSELQVPERCYALCIIDEGATAT